MMKRRDFVALLGGAAAAWPLAASAQPSQRPGKLPRIGVLGTATPAAWSPWTSAFEKRLAELGWIEGRTIAIEYRWAEGRPERYAEIAAQFVRLKVDAIVTGGPATSAAKQATAVIPIVFALASDPVGTGLVASLARPGGTARKPYPSRRSLIPTKRLRTEHRLLRTERTIAKIGPKKPNGLSMQQTHC